MFLFNQCKTFYVYGLQITIFLKIILICYRIDSIKMGYESPRYYVIFEVNIIISEWYLCIIVHVLSNIDYCLSTNMIFIDPLKH